MAQLASVTPSRAFQRWSEPAATQRSSSVRVAVDWSSAAITERSTGHVELTARLDAGARAAWSCVLPGSDGWEEAINASGCSEVVLTTWLGSESVAKDMVLDLAEHLTQKLKASKPLIRVRFLQREKRRAA